jgi:hypothetical protein
VDQCPHTPTRPSCPRPRHCPALPCPPFRPGLCRASNCESPPKIPRHHHSQHHRTLVHSQHFLILLSLTTKIYSPGGTTIDQSLSFAPLTSQHRAGINIESWLLLGFVLFTQSFSVRSPTRIHFHPLPLPFPLVAPGVPCELRPGPPPHHHCYSSNLASQHPAPDIPTSRQTTIASVSPVPCLLRLFSSKYFFNLPSHQELFNNKHKHKHLVPSRSPNPHG